MKKRLVVIGTIATLAIAAFGVTAAFGAADKSTTGVNWHPQQEAAGPVDDASATLIRNKRGVSYQLHTNSLVPNNAYTLWVVVVNNPWECDPQPCAGPDILTNDAIDAQVLYGAGHVAGGSGKGTFAGSLKEGELDGWLPNRTFDDAGTAEIHLVINDHGPALPQYLPGMIKTYRGGCADNSPFPGIFPETALADGDPGPNTCRLFQSAIFSAS